VGGIGDALMAGNLALAGRIALKGLEIIFAEGMNTIADLIGGTLGDTIGQLADQITSGDFAGAWQTAVAGMAALWANFSQGVVKVFTAAASAVVGAWKGAVQAIANYLLDASAQGGFMGAVASKILGVDMSQEQAVAEKNRLAQIEVKKRLLEQAEKDAATADTQGTHRGLTGDAYRKFASDLRSQIAGLEGTKVNVTEDAKKVAGQQIGGIGASVNDFLNSVKQQADQSADQANRNLRTKLGPGGSHRADVGRLNNELDGLTNKAAKERAGIKDVQLPDKAEPQPGQRRILRRCARDAAPGRQRAAAAAPRQGQEAGRSAHRGPRRPLQDQGQAGRVWLCPVAGRNADGFQFPRTPQQPRGDHRSPGNHPALRGQR
jgi:hypothetical protein